MGTEKPVAASIYNTATHTHSFISKASKFTWVMSQYAKDDRQYLSEGAVCYSPHMTSIENNGTYAQPMHQQHKKDTRRERERARERAVGHSRQSSHKNNITTITKPPLKSYFHHKPLCSLSYYLFCLHHISHMYDLVQNGLDAECYSKVLSVGHHDIISYKLARLVCSPALQNFKCSRANVQNIG